MADNSRSILGYKIAIEFDVNAVSKETGLPLAEVYSINKNGSPKIPPRNPEPPYQWVSKNIKKIQKEIEKITKKQVLLTDKESLLAEKQARLKPTRANEDFLVDLQEYKSTNKPAYDKQGRLIKDPKIRGLRVNGTQTRYTNATKIGIGMFSAGRSKGYWVIDEHPGEHFPELLITYKVYDPKKYRKYESSPFYITKTYFTNLADEYLRYIKNVLQDGTKLARLAESTLRTRKSLAKKLGCAYGDKPLFFTGTLYNSLRCAVYENNVLIGYVGG